MSPNTTPNAAKAANGRPGVGRSLAPPFASGKIWPPLTASSLLQAN
jgi:hypothetical protein